MVAAAASPTDSASPQPNPMTTYQEEICEKLIQLSFVKIVSSKNERGGARLRKNLLILHLLQKARMEQRNRLFAAAASRNLVANQRPEMTSSMVNAEIPLHQTQSEMAIEDMDANQGQHECHENKEESTTCPDSHHAHTDTLPHCDKHDVHEEISHTDAMTGVDDGEHPSSSQLHVDSQSLEGPSVDDQTDADAQCSSQTCVEAQPSTNISVDTQASLDDPRSTQASLDNPRSTQTTLDTTVSMSESHVANSDARRSCLKRKHDSSETSCNNNDWNSSSSPKMACIMRHRTASESSPNNNSSPLNELFFYKTTTTTTAGTVDDDDDETEGQGQTVTPLTRSLSCSSFMELTCES